MYPLKASATGDVYGAFYTSNLMNRLFKKAVYSAGKTRIEWVVAGVPVLLACG